MRKEASSDAPDRSIVIDCRGETQGLPSLQQVNPVPFRHSTTNCDSAAKVILYHKTIMCVPERDFTRSG